MHARQTCNAPCLLRSQQEALREYLPFRSPHLANQFRGENTVVVGCKSVRNDAVEMSMSKDSKQKAWLEHYRQLLNAEFDWDPDYLSDEPPVEGPPIPITSDMVLRKLSLR